MSNHDFTVIEPNGEMFVEVNNLLNSGLQVKKAESLVERLIMYFRRKRLSKYHKKIINIDKNAPKHEYTLRRDNNGKPYLEEKKGDHI